MFFRSRFGCKKRTSYRIDEVGLSESALISFVHNMHLYAPSLHRIAYPAKYLLNDQKYTSGKDLYRGDQYGIQWLYQYKALTVLQN